jgi:GMP synthase (glutamine-hydrolysing)
MRKIMVFQHVGHEPLGTLNPMLKEAGFRIRYVNFGRHPDMEPSLEGYNGLIVLGGPMGVYEAAKHPHLKLELKLIEESIKKNIPVLGICLGAQLIAAALGARVYKAPRWELGWCDLHLTDAGKGHRLFEPYGKSEKIFQLHQDTFDLPRSAHHLAQSELCAGQAFHYGEKVFGLQFHLEADRPMILRWIQRPENRKLIEQSHGAVDTGRIEADTDTHIARSLELSRHTFGRFIDIFQLPERPVLLGSSHGKPPKGGG